jgi:hypothetical protein
VKIELLLNNEDEASGELRTALTDELMALSDAGVEVTISSKREKAGALADFGVMQFVLEYGKEAIEFVAAVILLTNTVLQRYGRSPRDKKGSRSKQKRHSGTPSRSAKEAPIVVVNVGSASLELPSSDRQTAAFVKKIAPSKARDVGSEPRARAVSSKKAPPSKPRSKK